MAVEEHEICVWPEDEEAVIWRYVDLPKYLSMLQSRSLFFCRVDMLDDPFEGSLSLATVEAETAAMEEALEAFEEFTPQQRKELVAASRKNSARWARSMRRWSAINCWHLAQHESAGMWAAYDREGAGIAIRSSFDRLRASLDVADVTVYLGRVTYLDYSSEPIPRRWVLNPILTKRLSFKHEHELRAIVRELAVDEDGRLDFEASKWDMGLEVPVDVERLVERVHVAPTAPTWFANVVSDVTSRYDFSWEVRQSSLTGEPIF